MQSILVTGATGFMGSRLVSELVRKEYAVSALVKNGKHIGVKTDEIVWDLMDPNLNFVDRNFDCVFHLASHTPMEKNFKVLESVNLNGTKNLFEAINGKTKSIIYISGLGVYGDPGGKQLMKHAPITQTPNLSRSD